jgi:hypothetical protein
MVRNPGAPFLPVSAVVVVSAGLASRMSLGRGVLTAVAAAGLVHPVHATPAPLALATTNSWVLAFDVSAALLLAASIATGVLVRPAAPN